MKQLEVIEIYIPKIYQKLKMKLLKSKEGIYMINIYIYLMNNIFFF